MIGLRVSVVEVGISHQLKVVDMRQCMYRESFESIELLVAEVRKFFNREIVMLTGNPLSREKSIKN